MPSPENNPFATPSPVSTVCHVDNPTPDAACIAAVSHEAVNKKKPRDAPAAHPKFRLWGNTEKRKIHRAVCNSSLEKERATEGGNKKSNKTITGGKPRHDSKPRKSRVAVFPWKIDEPAEARVFLYLSLSTTTYIYSFRGIPSCRPKNFHSPAAINNPRKSRKRQGVVKHTGNMKQI